MISVVAVLMTIDTLLVASVICGLELCRTHPGKFLKGCGWISGNIDTAPEGFYQVFVGECSTGSEIRMYEGNGDNPGSEAQRILRCSDACLTKKQPITSKYTCVFQSVSSPAIAAMRQGGRLC